MKTIRMFLGATMLALGVWQMTARADSPVAPPTPAPAPSVSPAPVVAPAAPSANQGMTADQLGKLLEGLGYQPEAYKNDSGEITGYSIKINEPNDTWYMNFDLSKDGQRIWVSMNLTQIQDFKNVPAETLAKLFKENELSNGYPYFAMYNNNMLVLEMSENTGILTPQWLREDIGIVLNEAKHTVDLWTAQALGQATSPGK
jgi:hypothetical protein